MIHLIRTSYTDKGVRGILLMKGLNRALHTIEKPWRENRRNVSCIPTGTYRLIENFFHKGGYNSVQIEGVPNRDHIQFHIANLALDLEGCVGVGMRKGQIGGKPAVMHSVDAFYKHFQPAALDLVPCRIRIQDLEATPLDPFSVQALEVATLQEILEEA